jgi:hypothetical protein
MCVACKAAMCASRIGAGGDVTACVWSRRQPWLLDPRPNETCVRGPWLDGVQLPLVGTAGRGRVGGGPGHGGRFWGAMMSLQRAAIVVMVVVVVVVVGC